MCRGRPGAGESGMVNRVRFSAASPANCPARRVTATIPVVVTAEDGPAPADLLVKRLVMAQGLFPEERLFVPLLPAEPRPGGV